MGVRASTAVWTQRGLSGAEGQMEKLEEEPRMKDKSGVELGVHLVSSLLTVPAGLLSLLVIVALWFKAKARHLIGGDLKLEQDSGREIGDF